MILEYCIIINTLYIFEVQTCDCHFIVKLDNDPTGEELSGEIEQVRVVEQDQELGEPSLLHHHGGGGPACGPGEVAGELTLHVTPTARQSHPHPYIIYVEQYDFHQGSQIF